MLVAAGRRHYSSKTPSTGRSVLKDGVHNLGLKAKADVCNVVLSGDDTARSGSLKKLLTPVDKNISADCQR